MSSDDFQDVPCDVGGVPFTVRVFPDPSGIRAQVWYGEERIAGLRLFHSDDIDRALQQVRSNKAVLRAADRLSSSATTGAPA